MFNRKNLWGIVTFFLLVSVLFMPESGLAQKENFKTIRFAVIGDRTGTAMDSIYQKVVAEVIRLHPDFVVTPGDCIEGYSSDETEIRKQWKEYLEIVQVFGKNLFIAPGNHDILDTLSERIYLELVGKPYYSFDKGGIHFIMLDLSRWDSGNQLPAEQLDWLTADLKANQNAAYSIALFHKPAWYEGITKNRPDTLHTLFANYGVDAVFTGHYHEYFSDNYDGIKYTCVGSSGGEYGQAASQLGYHYLWVTVDSTGIYITPIKLGSVFDWSETTVADKMAYDPIYMLGLGFAAPYPVSENMTPVPGEIAVIVNNSLCKFDLNDSLVWDVPDNWKIEPKVAAVSVKAGENQHVKFHVECLGKLYPLPTVSTNLKYGENHYAHASHSLWIARQAVCVPVVGEFNPDGLLTESFWQSPESLFVNYDGDTMAADPFRIYFAHDDSNLYIGAFCAEMRMDSMVAASTAHDGPVYAEDCLGFFIQPESAPDTCYQIYFNPQGAAYDVRITRGPDGFMDYDKAWNGEYQAKAAFADKFWTFEAKIPLAQLGARIEKGKDWGVNFRRKQKRLNAASDWQVPLGPESQSMGILNIR